eukprot:jgi/Chrzof1/14463/Cz09g03260.t1
MASVSPASVTFEGHPGRQLVVLLFTNVTNSRDIRQKILTADINPEFAFINAEAVPDLLPLQLAAHKALTADVRGKLITKTLHSELVCNLSGSKHIAETLKRFGVSDTTQNLLVARFDATPQDLEYIISVVEGQQVPLESLASVAKAEVISKYYKISGEELKIGSVVDAIACRIAARDCI